MNQIMSLVPSDEKKKYDEWIESHYKGVHGENGEWPYTGAIGGAITYMFTPTSIGTSFCVRCDFCKQEFDLTSYEFW